MVQTVQNGTTTVEEGNPLVQIGGATVAGLGTGAVVREVLRRGNQATNMQHYLDGTVDKIKVDDAKKAVETLFNENVSSKEGVFTSLVRQATDNAKDIQSGLEVASDKALDLKQSTGKEIAGSIRDVSKVIGKTTDEQYKKVFSEEHAEGAKKGITETKSALDKAFSAAGNMSTTQKVGVALAGAAVVGAVAYALRPRTHVVETGERQQGVGGQAHMQGQGM